MDWAERQEYYDLIEEEIKFSPEKGQKWILSFEERHTLEHDILYHVYSEKGEYMLLAYEIVDVMKLEVVQRLHKLGEALSGNLRIYLSTLRMEIPAEMEPFSDAKDGSRFKLTFAKKDTSSIMSGNSQRGQFKRIKPC